MEDREIIELYWKRDESAIAETKRKYGSYCFSTAYNILFSRQDAEECENDTYAKAWDLMPPERPSILKYFLAKITRGFALNRLRTETREKRGGGESAVCFEEMENVLGTSDVPVESLNAKEMGLGINRFLSRRKQKERVMFVRRYFYMESVKKIASDLNVSENSVSVTLNRMRKDLKAYLLEEGLL